MFLQSVVAAVHLLALGIGLGAITFRAHALRSPFGISKLPPVFLADSLWGVAALLWISTGLWRAFGGLEKGTAYYLMSSAFWIKMTLLAIILIIEVWPMSTITRWRIARVKGADLNLSAAPRLARVSMLQGILVVAMVFAATAMARGLSF